MKPLTEDQVKEMMFEVQRSFDFMIHARIPLMTANILNIESDAIMEIYNEMPDTLKKIFVPGEEGNTHPECLEIHYAPAHGCLVILTSEPVAIFDKVLEELKSEFNPMLCSICNKPIPCKCHNIKINQ